MSTSLQGKIKFLSEESEISTLFLGMGFGIERECLRVDMHGALSKKLHPRELGAKLTQPNITTDYAECQLEFPSSPATSTKAVLKQLQHIHSFVGSSIKEELLWPCSMPSKLPLDHNQIPIARYGSSAIAKLKELYRIGLGVRYGRGMQTISGIHFNISYPSCFWQILHTKEKSSLPLGRYRDEQSFGLLRNYFRYFWLSLYLFGSSPCIDKTFLSKKPTALRKLGKRTYVGDYATTLRMSEIGYSNSERCKYKVSHNSLFDFIIDLQEATHTPCKTFKKYGLEKNSVLQQINMNILQLENEYYAPIRPKQSPHSADETISEALRARGVGYIEVRTLDVDPWSPIGIDEKTLDFMTVFVTWCLLSNSPFMTEAEQAESLQNQRSIALYGRKPGIRLLRQGVEIALEQWANDVFAELITVATLLDKAGLTKKYTAAILREQKKISDSTVTPSAKILSEIEQEGDFLSLGLQYAMKNHQYFLQKKLSETLQQQFEQAAQKSWAIHEQLEREQPGEDFSLFLKRYQ